MATPYSSPDVGTAISLILNKSALPDDALIANFDSGLDVPIPTSPPLKKVAASLAPSPEAILTFCWAELFYNDNCADWLFPVSPKK